MSTVFDASALLALLKQEPGWEIAEARLTGATMSAVNVSEVVSRLSDLDFEIEEARALIDDLAFHITPFDRTQAFLAGELRAPTKHLGLSLGDRACLALAKTAGRDVITADRAWTGLEVSLNLRIESIR